MTPRERIAAVGLALLVRRFAAGARRRRRPRTALAAAPRRAPAPPPADPSATAAALQQAKDAFKKGAWQEARDAAAVVLEAQPKHLEALYIAGTSERQTNLLPDAGATPQDARRGLARFFPSRISSTATCSSCGRRS